jgi:DNA-binding transcriptional LysR family regulator
MDKLHAMSVFVQIAERGSLTAAAEALDKSLPTVVRILAALEDALRVRLLNRTTRRIALTEEGAVYLEQCRRILAHVEETERALGRRQAEPSGRIAITAPVRFGEMHVAPAVAGFLKRYPKTRVDLLLVDRIVDLLEEGIDLAVRIAPLADSTLVARSIGAIRPLVCASPELLQRVGRPQRPEQLIDLPCIRFDGISAGEQWDFLDQGKPLTVRFDAALRCNQVGGAVAACAAGAGFGRFFCYQVMPSIRRGTLVSVLDELTPGPLPLSLVYPHARLLSSRVRAMVDWLAEGIPRSLESL